MNISARVKEAGLHPNRVQTPTSSSKWQEPISAHVNSGGNYKALELYQQVQDSIKPSQALFLCILKACASIGVPGQGRYIHDQVIRNGFPSDGVIGNTLIHMYAKCGALDEAQKMFDALPKRSAVSWSAIISGYVQHGHGPKAIELFDTMQHWGVRPSRASFLSILKACGSIGDIGKGRLFHDQIIRRGLESDMVVGSTILDMYAKCGSLDEARTVFDDLPSSDVVSWNALLAGYSQHEEGHLALKCFEKMQQKGIKPTQATFVCILKACSSISGIEEGRLIHDQITRMMLFEDEVIGSTLIGMYAKCGRLVEARKMFEKQLIQSVGLWGVMITGYVQHGHDLVALELFDKMLKVFRAVDRVVYLSILKACGNLKAVVQGGMIHDQILRNAEEFDVVLGSALVDMYCKCGILEAARVVFEKLSSKNVVSWGAMIAGYAEHGHGHNALDLYKNLQNEGIAPNRALFLSTLKACGSLGDIWQGRLLHGQIFTTGLDSDVVVESTLVDMYAKCRCMDEAVFCFDKMQIRDVVSWNAMIAGYTQHGCDYLALELFEKMQKEKVEPDKVTILFILQACGRLGATAHGRFMHSMVIGSRLASDVVIGSNLVDMYSRCGSLEEAHKVLVDLPKQDVVSWSALIAGYAEVGNCWMVRKCFESMLQQGLKPDSKTFTSLLCACSHAGEVEEGYRHFKAMKQDYGITPSIEHFNCMIGLLAHAGCLEEATKVINTMPISPDMTGWMSLIIACRNYGSFQLGRNCFNEVVQMDRNVASGYVLMSNIYADLNMWVHANKTQESRKHAVAWKKPALASIEVKDKVHEFVLGDIVNTYMDDDIHLKSERLERVAIEFGLVPQLDLVPNQIVV